MTAKNLTQPLRLLTRGFGSDVCSLSGAGFIFVLIVKKCLLLLFSPLIIARITETSIIQMQVTMPT